MNDGKRSPRALVLATSYAPELRRPELRPALFPRTDYVELAKLADCDILDYSIYDSVPRLGCYRLIEKKLRMDFHLALLGYRRAKDYDVVVLMSERVAIPYAMLSRAFGSRSQTVFLSMHSSKKQARVFRRLGCAREISRTVSFTPSQAEFLTDSIGLEAGSISYIPYAIDEEFFCSQSAGDGDYILTAGGVPGRDYSTLISALGGLEVPVTIVSGGRAYGRKTAGEFRDLPPNIRWLSGLSSAEMRALYEGARMVVLPLSRGRADGAGTSVLLEAMAMAKAAVVSNSPGISHYVEDGTTGILVEPEDTEALRDAVLRLYHDTGQCAALGANARRAITTNLSFRHYAERLRSVVVGMNVAWPIKEGATSTR